MAAPNSHPCLLCSQHWVKRSTSCRALAEPERLVIVFIPPFCNFTWANPAILPFLVQDTVINYPCVTPAFCFNATVSSLALEQASLGLLLCTPEAVLTDASFSHLLAFCPKSTKPLLQAPLTQRPSLQERFLSLLLNTHVCWEIIREIHSLASAVLRSNWAFKTSGTS